jgi:hypothetical protein
MPKIDHARSRRFYQPHPFSRSNYFAASGFDAELFHVSVTNFRAPTAESPYSATNMPCQSNGFIDPTFTGFGEIAHRQEPGQTSQWPIISDPITLGCHFHGRKRCIKPQNWAVSNSFPFHCKRLACSDPKADKIPLSVSRRHPAQTTFSLYVHSKGSSSTDAAV